MAAKTRADLVEDVARQLGGYLNSTATGGSTTTIVDSSYMYQPDNWWVHFFVYILTKSGEDPDAAPAGEERLAVDLDQGTYTLTVDPAFTAAVGAGDDYEVLPMRRADILSNINRAIREASGVDGWHVVGVDTSTITLADDDYAYNLPADVVALRRVWYRDDSDEAYKILDGSLWNVSGVPGAQELLLTRLGGLEAGDTLRLEYVKLVSELDDDDDTLGLGEPAETDMVEFVIWWAVRLCFLEMGARGGGRFREFLTLASDAEKTAEGKRKGIRGQGGQGTVKFERWARSRS